MNRVHETPAAPPRMDPGRASSRTLQYELPPPRVKDIPSRLRPRELCDEMGLDHVPDDVLLAIVLRSGVKGMSVIEIAHRLLREYGSLTALAQVSSEELSGLRGMGLVKAQVLKAALELARRLSSETAQASPSIRTPEEAASILREQTKTREAESFWVLLLDAKNRMKRQPVEVSRGLLNASLAHPREVFREAIRSSTAAVVLVHNHPSGDPTPSAEDLALTRQLVEAGRIIDIPVLDHIILGQRCESRGTDYCSLRESGLVAFT